MSSLCMQKLTFFHRSWMHPVQYPRHGPRFLVKFIDLFLYFLAYGVIETCGSGKWTTGTSRISTSLSSRSLSCSTSMVSMYSTLRRSEVPSNLLTWFLIVSRDANGVNSVVSSATTVGSNFCINSPLPFSPLKEIYWLIWRFWTFPHCKSAAHGNRGCQESHHSVVQWSCR